LPLYGDIMNTRRSDHNIPGLPARQSALRLLDAVFRTGAPLDHAVQNACKGLAPPDRALAIAIAQEVLRWTPDLDALIDGATSQTLPEDAKARMVLRMALAQMLRLGTPPHAAISTALPLVESGPRRLVHGVLGTLFRAQSTLPDSPTLSDMVAMRWHAAWGDDMLDAAATALTEPPDLDLTLKDPATTAEYAARLNGVSLLPGHLRLQRGVAVEELDGFEAGDWWVQDIAASLPVRLLGQGEGRPVLDLCAAPGGKTMQLAAAGWNVTAVDHSARRLERLSANMHRTGLTAEMVVGDIMTWQPEAPVDAILLDAPCSATGTFRRNPDVLHRIGNRQISELVEIQSNLLGRIADWLKPGGQLIYATCSLEPQEGEHQINAFLKDRPDFAIAPIDSNDLPQEIEPTHTGYVRTLPDMLSDKGGLDGFFIAKLIRN
jgi:16S rRNA (cytosine967-C5)-methyltransferase